MRDYQLYGVIKKSLTHLNSNNRLSANSLKSRVLQVLHGFKNENIDTIANIGAQLFKHQKSLYTKYKDQETNNSEKKEICYNQYDSSGIIPNKINLLKLMIKKNHSEPEEPNITNFIVLYYQYLKKFKFNNFNKQLFTSENPNNRLKRIIKNLSSLERSIPDLSKSNKIQGGNKVKSLKDKHKNELNKLKLKHNNELIKLKNKQKKELKSKSKKSTNKCCNCNKNFSSKTSLTNHKKKCN